MRHTGTTCSAVGGVFGAFCPACIPALAVFLPTVGLGFLANITVSRILLLAFVAFALIALHSSALAHRRQGAFVLGTIASMGVIAGRTVLLNPWLIYGASAGLIAAAVLDWVYRRRTCPPTYPRSEVERASRS